DNVQATAGIFTITLDFGASPFTSAAANSLEIAVRPGLSTGAYTTLSPRQPLTSSPYSIQSGTATNSTQLGGIAASQYVLTTDSRMNDARDPLPGSVNYIRNGTALQPSSAFRISGKGTVGSMDVDTDLRVGNNVTITSGLTASTLGGNGAGLTNLNASNITTG